MSLLSDIDVARDSEAFFEYTTLPSEPPGIRLLTLLPSSLGAKVQCALTNHTWDVETGSVLPSSSGGTVDAIGMISFSFYLKLLIAA
jgi:hypothetical protein